ncbi:MAG: hypothetical protein ACYS9C_07675 [Planctomycetota bacterium]|jgi:hypothetical protein
MKQDEEHLKLLSIFHYVAGGITGVLACFPIMHLIMGIFILAVACVDQAEAPVVIMGLIFVVMSLTFIILGWTFAVCLIVSGRQLARRRRYTFCFVIACISCMLMPYGTVLGVFTIIVLMRPAVKELFAAT